MNQKFMMFLSVLLIIVAIIGLSLTVQRNKAHNQAMNLVKPKLEEKEANVLVLVKDIKAGSSIDLSDFSTKKMKIKDDNDYKNGYILSKDINEFKGAIATMDIKANEKISKDMLAKKGTKEYSRFRLSPKKGLLSYKFSLGSREKKLLEDVSPNQPVDIYFKYAMKNPDKDKPDGLAPKKDKYNQSDEQSTNIVKLVPMFKQKRVLYFTPKFETVKDISNVGKFENKNVEVENEGNVFVELSQDEVKKIYSLQGLGDFVLFPSDEKSYQNAQSTNLLLTKEFIRQIRGNQGDNVNEAH